jgi:ATP adenylyltransferase
MDYLWTPWRYHYVSTADDAGVCVFCAAAQSADDRKNLVVHRAEFNFIILNRYPYCSGHLMVIPYRHAATLADLSDQTTVELMRLACRCEKALKASYSPDGMNLGMNIGKSAGAGIAGHVHLHILPRWTGDTNFMTVVGETRVVPEDLDVTWEKLRAHFGPEPPMQAQ